MNAILSLGVVCGVAISVAAADEPAEKPPAAPLAVEITGKASYPLDFNGATPKKYAAAIAAAGKGDIHPPSTPTVDLKVVVTNSGKEDVLVYKSGDPFTIELTLAGSGSKNIAPPLAMTLEFRIPEHTELGPGESIAFPVENADQRDAGGVEVLVLDGPRRVHADGRGHDRRVLRPAGAPDASDGFGRVTAKSAPFKVTVTAKKD